MLKWLVILALAAAGALIAFLCFKQDSLIYFPQRYGPELLGERARAAGLTLWPGGGEGEYRGLLSRDPVWRVRGTVVVFHGNAGSALGRTYYRDALVPLGFRVLLAEYPAYGPRDGSLGERSLVADAIQTVRLVRERFPGPVYLWAESLGCGVAAAAARDLSGEIAGLALLTPWADLPRLAKEHYPFLPVGLLLRDRYDNTANLSAFARPVAVMVAERDEIIPALHSRLLFDSLAFPRRLWLFRGAGHNSWPSSAREAWWKEAADFLEGAGTDTGEARGTFLTENLSQNRLSSMQMAAS